MRIIPPSLQPLFFMSASLRRIDAFSPLPITRSSSTWRRRQRRTTCFFPDSHPSIRCIATRQDALTTNNYNNTAYSLTLCIPTPEDMQDMGGLLSVHTQRGDILFLDGDLGAGKTCFSRGFVRARTGAWDERVTSPTYLLSNCYLADGGETRIYHLDLYRLSGSNQDLLPLDLDNIFQNCISLVEWPSRLPVKPDNRLDVTFTIEPGAEMNAFESKSRIMKLEPHGDRWVERLKVLETEGYFDDLIVESSRLIDEH